MRLYDTLTTRYGVRPVRAREAFEPVLLSRAEAALLGGRRATRRCASSGPPTTPRGPSWSTAGAPSGATAIATAWSSASHERRTESDDLALSASGRGAPCACPRPPSPRPALPGQSAATSTSARCSAATGRTGPWRSCCAAMDDGGHRDHGRPRWRPGRRAVAPGRAIPGAPPRPGRRCSRASTTTRGPRAGVRRAGGRRLRDSAGAGRPRAQGLEAPRASARDPAGRLVTRRRRAPRPAVAGGRRSSGCRWSSTSPTPSRSSSRSTHANERWEELRAHPDWHFWPPRDVPDGPGYPGLRRAAGRPRPAPRASPGDDLRRGACGLRRRRTWGSSSGDARAPPELHVDIAARIARARPAALHGAAVLPALARAHPVRHGHCRRPARPAASTTGSWRPSTTRSTTAPEPVPPQGRWQIHGLGLPADVLRACLRRQRHVLHPASVDSA